MLPLLSLFNVCSGCNVGKYSLENLCLFSEQCKEYKCLPAHTYKTAESFAERLNASHVGRNHTCSFVASLVHERIKSIKHVAKYKRVLFLWMSVFIFSTILIKQRLLTWPWNGRPSRRRLSSENRSMSNSSINESFVVPDGRSNFCWKPSIW